jgi:hypothetical protein
MLPIDPTIFTSNLLKTQQYCHLRMKKGADTGTVFRSFNLNIIPENVNSLFHEQLAYKASCLAGITPSNEKYQGNIIISNIDESVNDGASEVSSAELFDQYDIPPVDTWFYLMKAENGTRILFAWIPQAYLHDANEAVDVNCVDCIGWFKDWYPEEYKQYYLLAPGK